MAESADVLGRDGQVVILPDLNAGCSMADMAEITQVEDCWEQLQVSGVVTPDNHGVTRIDVYEFYSGDQSFSNTYA